MKESEPADGLGDLIGHSTVLIISNAGRTLDNTVNVIKRLQPANDTGVYITVNQPYSVLKKILDEGGVDTNKLFFIDCISKSASAAVSTEKTKDCLYLLSPSGLTELSISIMQALELVGGEKRFIFMDSLSTFLLYNSAGTLSKFSHFLITKLSLIGVNGIFMSVESEMDEKFLNDLQSFCQKTIRV